MNLAAPAIFVGRDTELVEIARLLRDPACHFLTLVGPGGIGKTRLAVEAGRQLAVSDNVHFVPLQPLTSVDFIILAIADALNYQFSQGRDPAQQLLDYLRETAPLLILDNFEHLMDSAELLSRIITYAPGVRLLVTSRERLNLVEEWVLELGGLAYPANDEDADLERYSAVALFVHHARRVSINFAPNEHNKPMVSRICRLLGGMPLAIELAAAWVRVLSCEEIARELEHSLDILETPARNMEPRHRSLRIAFEPTWARLSEEERAVFRKLSVFRGGCTRKAAEAVAGASLRSLSALVDKSLLRVDVNGRFDLHELLRQYAEEQLKTCGEADVTRDAHCVYYAELLDRLATELKGPTQVRALDEIEADLDNVRVSWRWAVTQGKEREVLQSLDALLRFYQMRSRYVEGAEAFELAVGRFGNGNSKLLGQLLLAQAYFIRLGYNTRALAYFKKGMASLRLQDYDPLPLCLMMLVDYVDEFGGYDAVQRIYQDYLAEVTRKGDEWGAAWAVECMGYLAYIVGKYPIAPLYFQESLARFRALGDPWGSSWQISGLGLVAQSQNNFKEAHQYFLEHMRLCQETGDLVGVRFAHDHLGIVTRALGEVETSRRYTRDSLRVALESGSLYDRWSALAYAARHWMEAENQPERTVELFALVLHEPMDLPSTRGTTYETRRLIQGWWDVLKAKLPPGVFAAAVRRGETRNLKATVTEVLEQLTALDEPPDAIAPDAPGVARPPNQLLTERELQILRLIADGLSNREIADKLVLATSTIKWYVNEIFSKLDVASRTQAVARARERGLLT